MRPFSQACEHRGVSPVVGVILLVAITVLLSGILFTFVTTGIGPPPDAGTISAISSQQDGHRVVFTVSTTTANTTYLVKINGQTLHQWNNIVSGQNLRVNCLQDGDRVQLVEELDAETTVIRREYQIDNTDPPAGCVRHVVFADQHPATNNFEGGVDGWSGYARGDIRRLSSDIAYQGSGMLEVDPDPTKRWSGAFTNSTSTGTLNLTAGETYTFIGWFYIPEGTDLQGNLEFHPRMENATDNNAKGQFDMIESNIEIDNATASEGQWLMRYYVYEVDEGVPEPKARVSAVTQNNFVTDSPFYVDAIRVAEGNRIYNDSS